MTPEERRDEGKTPRVWKCRITDDWVPIPEALLKQLGWNEGDHLDVEIVSGTLLVTKSPDQQNPKKPGAIVGKRSLKQ